MSYKMPAEWEEHEGTWIAWPHNNEHWPGKFDPIPKTYVEIVQALAQSERVFICVNDEKMKQSAFELLKKGNVEMDKVAFYNIPTNASWSRDHGPIFVKDTQGQRVILDWEYNANGNKWGPCDLDDMVPQRIGEVFNIPVIKPRMVLEGGAIDVNGKGSLLTTKRCLLNKNRNPEFDQKQIEQNLKNYLGATNILWLEQGIIGDDTDGHIDDIARFVDDKTIVYAYEENKNDENYQILQKNYELLRDKKDQNRKPFDCIRLPMPDPIIYENQRLPASYCNFYIANKIVLVPTFQSQKDKKAIVIFKSLFPNRTIVRIDCVDLVWGFGAIHCSTQQQPR